MRSQVKKLKTYLGRVVRDIERKMAGNAAYEMAQQSRADGQRVSMLALLDTYMAFSPYPGEIDLFVAADGEAILYPRVGWPQLVTGKLNHYMVPRNHGLMVKIPNVEVLAEQLGRALNASGPG